MKLKQKISFFLLIGLISGWISTSAQNNIKFQTSEYFEPPLIGRSYNAPPVGKGSPFLYDSWLNGYAVFITGDTVHNKLFKFDCFKNEIIWMADGKSLIALDHNLIKGFGLIPTMGASKRIFEKTHLKLPMISDTLVRYLEVLSKGKMNLYAFRRVSVYSESTIGKSGGLYQLSSYEAEPVYFIQMENYPVKQVKFNKKSLVNAYPEYSAAIKKILREKQYGGIKNEYQLSQAVMVINSSL